MTEHGPLDGQYIAVLDRFEEELAVLLVEDDEDIITDYHLDKAALPEDGRHQDAIFHLQFDHGDLEELSYDQSLTESRKKEAQDRFDRLSKRLSSDDES